MKILYFYQYFATPKGAWSTRAYEFARRWVAQGHQVTVVTSVYDKSDLTTSGLVHAVEIDGIEVLTLGIRLSNRHGFLRRVSSFLLYALLSSWYAMTRPADVVLCSSGPITVGLPGLVARWLRGRPLVFEARDLWPEGAIQLGLLRNPLLTRAARWLEAACYRSARTVVALSPGQAEDIEARFEELEVEVVPNAADNDLARDTEPLEELPAWAEKKTLLVYAGTLGLIDDCGQLVELARELGSRNRTDLHVVVIGDGSERLEVEASAQDVPGIVFLGQMSREEVFRWLRPARVSLFTVKRVRFLATASPNKIFDAFASGLPVLQTTQGWIRSLLEQERCGLTVPEGNIVALADAAERLSDDDDLWAELSANARRVALTRFDRTLLASEMLAHLESAATR